MAVMDSDPMTAATELHGAWNATRRGRFYMKADLHSKIYGAEGAAHDDHVAI